MLGLVAEHLPPPLLAPEALARLRAAVGVVPPFAALGFERSLAAGQAAAIEFQLGARRHEAASAAAALTRARRDGSLPEAWEPVERLCREWLEPGSAIAHGVREVWCELDRVDDRDPSALDALVPSVFVVLDEADATARDAAREHTLALLAGGNAPALSAIVETCERACRDRAWVSHLGVMLGRRIRALRVHVSALPLAALPEFLEEIAWPGEIDRADAAARVLLDHGDHLVLCLDVAGGLLPRLGLEVFFGQRQGVDPRWQPLLDSLVRGGLAGAEEAAALLDWPGITVPQGHAWPDALIVAGLGQPAERIGVVERRLSHIKLTVAAGEPLRAKAYFGAGHVFWRARPDQAQRPTPERRPAGSAKEAIDGGLAFLLRGRNQAGWWRDFFDRARPAGIEQRVTGYSSDEWVTAYVATMLATVEHPAARAAASGALRLLLTRRERGGWGYHALLPADADTTTWVLRLADSLGIEDGERLRQAREFVIRQSRSDGGVCTYPTEAADSLVRFLAMPGPYDGWCATHTCVTAAAAALELGPASLQFLRRAQRPDGSWGGHWWEDDEYATARAVEALASHGFTGELARAGAWASGRFGTNGAVTSAAGDGPSPFATALALSVLNVVREPSQSAVRERASAWLASTQRADGSWTPSARLRVPAPAQLDPLAADPGSLTYVDDDALFTTATVLAALSGA